MAMGVKAVYGPGTSTVKVVEDIFKIVPDVTAFAAA